MIRFDGFSLPDRQRLIAALILLKAASAKASAALLSKNLTHFKTWFDGTGTNAHLMKVSTIVKEINDAVQTRSITFANGADGDQTVTGQLYSTGGTMGMVHLCANRQPGDKYSEYTHVGSGMRVLIWPRTHRGNIEDLCQTMYHELSHKVGGTDDVDSKYSEHLCKRYALLDPQKAALNAENYTLFFREFIWQ